MRASPTRTALAALALASALPGVAVAANAKPDTLPSLREWAGGRGAFVLRRAPRVVLADGDRARLGAEARTLASDLGRQVGRTVPVAGPRTRARVGDILLALGSGDRALGSEGYELRTGQVLVVRARTRAGVFYGGRTVLQLLHGRRSVARGRARDWPVYPERGLMLDNGRKYYRPGWLARHVREMAYLKLNLLHLHFSDNEGFRIESTSHPEVVTRPALTQKQVLSLITLATRYHVTVVPEIDSPGHMKAALRAHPELQLRNLAGGAEADKLDITSPAARRFIDDLVNEYLRLFSGPYWHLGGDEYLGIVSTPASYDTYPQLAAYARAKYGPAANGKDAVLDFVNHVAGVVRARGKTARMWSDGIGGGAAVQVDRRIHVEWWENLHSPTPQALIDGGHRVLNAGWWPTYYTFGGPLEGLRANMKDAYDQWNPSSFEGPYTSRWFDPGPPMPPPFKLAPGDPGVLGAALNVWADGPDAETEDEVAAGIAPRLRVIAQKNWGSPEPGDYARFQAVAAEMGHAPGY